MANKLDFTLIPEYEFTSPFMMLPQGLKAIEKFHQTKGARRHEVHGYGAVSRFTSQDNFYL